MLEADRKKAENIIEYILYMFHTEDLIRSLQLNPDLIHKTVVEPSKDSVQHKAELTRWYIELVENMERENIQDSGHLSDILEIIGELSYLHKKLITVFQDKSYIELWEKAYPNVVELQKRTNGAVKNPIELCFNGIYGVLILRMKNKEVNDETLEAVETFTNLLTYLGKKYNDIRYGRLKFPKTMQN